MQAKSIQSFTLSLLALITLNAHATTSLTEAPKNTKTQAKQATQPNQTASSSLTMSSNQSTVNARERLSASQNSGALPATSNFLLASQLFPRSFQIPGTQTQLKVFGMLATSAVYDTPHPSNYTFDALLVPIQGSGSINSRRPSNYFMSARNSFFGIETQTPTRFGTFKTYLSMVFYNSLLSASELASNRHSANLYYAYAQLNGFTIGQNYTNFQDLKAIPETLDWYVTVALTPNIQPQIAYTYKFNPNTAATIAIENPESDFYTTGSASGSVFSTTAPQSSLTATNIYPADPYPDITASLTTNRPWGEVTANAMVRAIQAVNLNTTGPAAPAVGANNKATVMGYGFALSSKYNLNNKNYLLGRIVAGKGIGRYVQSATLLGAIYNPVSNTIEAPSTQAAYVGGQYWWSDKWRSNAVYGVTHINNPSMAAQSMNKLLQSIAVNLIYNPVERFDIGLEYWHATRLLKGGDSSTNYKRFGGSNRFLLAMKAFF
jgi:hypothetical protein